jgi:hypothetical protein
LDRWADESHPWLSSLLADLVPYYWSVQEGEYATDIAFRTPEDLGRLYPRMVHQAYALLQSTDIPEHFIIGGTAAAGLQTRGGQASA